MKDRAKFKMSRRGNLPEVQLEAAEKVLRDIARRNGELVRKRRSASAKRLYGDGYCIIDPQRNLIRSQVNSSDGCDLSLADLAAWYEKDKRNTPWQRTVIKAVLAGKVASEEGR